MRSSIRGFASPTDLASRLHALRLPDQGGAFCGKRRDPQRPRPGYYVMRLLRGAPLVPALIYQLCPMVLADPGGTGGPDPQEWCRPSQRVPRFAALIDGAPADVEKVWATRSLRRVSAEEYEFRIGPLRRWAAAHPQMPETRPERPVDLAALPPLF